MIWRRPSAALGSRRLPARQRLALDVLHGEEQLPVDHADVVDLDHVGVGEPGQRLRLSLHPPAPRPARGCPGDQLEGDAAIELVIVGGEDHAHAALPELAQQRVATDLLVSARRCADHDPRRPGLRAGALGVRGGLLLRRAARRREVDVARCRVGVGVGRRVQARRRARPATNHHHGLCQQSSSREKASTSASSRPRRGADQ